MAKEVGFFENNVPFDPNEPFVISNPLNNGYRIEQVLPNHFCPVLPLDEKVYKISERLGLVGKSFRKELAEHVCDTLNKMVRDGELVTI